MNDIVAVENTVTMPKHVNNLVVVGDEHIGCKLALCNPDGMALDEDSRYMPSPVQVKVWEMWEFFWNEWVPRVCHGEPYVILNNGDLIDGVHHGVTTTITNNLTYQRQAAVEILTPWVLKNPLCAGYIHHRGTEVHGGTSGSDEEAMARSLQATPNLAGQYARYESWLRLGKALIHATHHIGTTGSAAYESTAPMREITNCYTEAGRWRDEPPDFVVRAHRHRQVEVRVPTKLGYGTVFCTPAWQLKTPLVFRIGMKMSQPQIGGSVIRVGDEDTYSRHKVWSLARAPVEEL